MFGKADSSDKIHLKCWDYYFRISFCHEPGNYKVIFALSPPKLIGPNFGLSFIKPPSAF